MTPDKIEKMVERLAARPREATDKTTLERSMAAYGRVRAESGSANKWGLTPFISVVQAGAVAAVLVALAVVVHLWGGRVDGTSVAWGQVAARVAKMEGYSYAVRIKMNEAGRGPNERDARIYASSAFGWRQDISQGGKVISMLYVTADNNEVVELYPQMKLYEKPRVQFDEPPVYNAKAFVESFTSKNHVSLGRSVIDGVHVEGISAELLSKVRGKLWVDVKTSLPVRMEITVYSGGQVEQEWVADKFDWSSKFDESQFRPVIPADYRLAKPLKPSGGKTTAPDANSPSRSKVAPADANSANAAGAGKKNERVIADGDAQTITVKVLDKETGKPLVSADVTVLEGRKSTGLPTEADGTATVKVKKGASNVEIRVKAAGHVGLMREYRSIPSECTFELDKGTVIGGIIRNLEGEPIEGANVELFTYRSGREPEKTEQFYIRNMVVTSKDGKWQFDTLPSQLENIGISVSHKNYQSTGVRISDNDEPSLRDQSHVAVMRHGIRIYGIVTRPDGAPVAGATVIRGNSDNQSDEYRVKTDEQGRFEFCNGREEPQMLTMKLKGYAPDLKVIPLDEVDKEVVFVLAPGHTLKGRVVDSRGAAVAKASVYTNEWRGGRTLNKRKTPDANGRFEFTDMPADEFEVCISKQNLLTRKIQGVIADGHERVFTLGEQLRVRGKVTDAETGQPIANFRLVPGIAWEPGDPISWQNITSWIGSFKGGQYEYMFDSAGTKYGVRIEADGYVPLESRAIEPNETEVTCDFALKKSSGIKGIVYARDGKPAAGVSVTAARNGIYLNEGRFDESHPVVKTDANGVFSLPEMNQGSGPMVAAVKIDGQGRETPMAQPDSSAAIVAAGPAGIGWSSLEDLRREGAIRLMAWGRIEGEYFVGSKPAADRDVMTTYPDHESGPIALRFFASTRTDTDGKFRFERVVPGTHSVNGRTLDIKPGETTHLKIGGDGRTVTAELILPEELRDKAGSLMISCLVEKRFYDEAKLYAAIPWPSGAETMSYAELSSWLNEFQKTDEWTKIIEGLRNPGGMPRTYSVKEAGRRLTAENIPAGKYVLTGGAWPRKADGSVDYGQQLCRVSFAFEVPPIEEGQLDVPLDLGAISTRNRLKVGDLLPDVALETADGTPVRLADYAGKIVLVTTCLDGRGADDPEIGRLLQIHAKYNTNSQFVMIGIVPASRSNVVMRAMVREAARPWLQAYLVLGDANRSLTNWEGALAGSVSSVLVGGDGKIIGMALAGEELVKKVEEAMAAKQQF
jgi:protocatechuate 3,4-dioxygenase beta subunit